MAQKWSLAWCGSGAVHSGKPPPPLSLDGPFPKVLLLHLMLSLPFPVQGVGGGGSLKANWQTEVGNPTNPLLEVATSLALLDP